MEIKIEKFASNDLEDAIKIWNEIVCSGNAFPQDKPLSIAEGEDFFKSQSFTGIAKNEKEIVGLYILHPNNVGRCGHIANASYAVSQKARGQGVGELLVKDSIKKAQELGFKILQFNAVVADNYSARKLYKKLGFIELGTVKDGFKTDNENYKDIVLYYISL